MNFLGALVGKGAGNHEHAEKAADDKLLNKLLTNDEKAAEDSVANPEKDGGGDTAKAVLSLELTIAELDYDKVMADNGIKQKVADVLITVFLICITKQLGNGYDGSDLKVIFSKGSRLWGHLNAKIEITPKIESDLDNLKATLHAGKSMIEQQSRAKLVAALSGTEIKRILVFGKTKEDLRISSSTASVPAEVSDASVSGITSATAAAPRSQQKVHRDGGRGARAKDSKLGGSGPIPSAKPEVKPEGARAKDSKLGGSGPIPSAKPEVKPEGVCASAKRHLAHMLHLDGECDAAYAAEGAKAVVPAARRKAPCVRITIVGAEGCRKTDDVESANVYCVCSIPGKKKMRCKTPVVQDTLRPTWNFTHEFSDYAPSDSLHFSVHEKDVLADEILGYAEISIAECSDQSGFYGQLELKDASGNANAKLLVKVEILPALDGVENSQQSLRQGVKAGHKVVASLWITIVGAKGLQKAGLGGSIAPFCVCSVPGKRKMRCKTPVVKESQNPSWNFQHEFADFVEGDSFHFAVYDKDQVADELLGTAVITSKQLSLPSTNSCPVVNAREFSVPLELRAAGNGRSATLIVRAEFSKDVEDVAFIEPQADREATTSGKLQTRPGQRRSVSAPNTPRETHTQQAHLMASRQLLMAKSDSAPHVSAAGAARRLAKCRQEAADLEKSMWREYDAWKAGEQGGCEKRGQHRSDPAAFKRLCEPRYSKSTVTQVVAQAHAKAEAAKRLTKSVSNPELLQRLAAPRRNHSLLAKEAAEQAELDARRCARPLDIDRISDLAEPRHIPYMPGKLVPAHVSTHQPAKKTPLKSGQGPMIDAVECACRHVALLEKWGAYCASFPPSPACSQATDLVSSDVHGAKDWYADAESVQVWNGLETSEIYPFDCTLPHGDPSGEWRFSIHA